MRNLEKPLATIKGRWMTGMTGAEAAPDPWKPLIGDAPDAELRLLALTAQAGEVGWRPAAPMLTIKPPMPTLALPTMPEAARIRFRRILDHQKPSAEDVTPILSLIEARGYCTHPGDWMPGISSTATPDLYGPWVDWLSMGDDAVRGGDRLSAENWDDFLPRERRAALTAMRKTDPAGARALVAERASHTAAEERLGLITILGDGLSNDDVPFLESLDKDRSGKVKSLAATLLARLGAGTVDSELAHELAEMLEVKSSKGSLTLGPKKLKNDAQRKRRIELFDLVPLHSLADVLEISQDDAVTGWRVGTHGPTTDAFAMMVAMTGSEALQRPLVERLMEEGRLDAVAPLVPRLTAKDRLSLSARAMRIEGDRFRLAVDFHNSTLGNVPMEALAASPDHDGLLVYLKDARRQTEIALAALKSDDETKKNNQPKTSWQTEAKIDEIIVNIGLLADQSAAAAMIDTLTGQGLISADPRLNMLYLNAALTEPTA